LRIPFVIGIIAISLPKSTFDYFKEISNQLVY